VAPTGAVLKPPGAKHSARFSLPGILERAAGKGRQTVREDSLLARVKWELPKVLVVCMNAHVVVYRAAPDNVRRSAPSRLQTPARSLSRPGIRAQPCYMHEDTLMSRHGSPRHTLSRVKRRRSQEVSAALTRFFLCSAHLQADADDSLGLGGSGM
jgi:hypothetical protein